jgi:hypothetical protein
MSLQRIFSLFVAIIGTVGFLGSLTLDMTAPHNIGPGFTPLVFSLGLLVCAVPMFILDKSDKKFDVRACLLKGEPGKALGFFLFNVVLLILMYLFGTLVAMVVFCILAAVVLKRQTLLKLIVFSIAWVGILYFTFAVLLKVPFERGLVFEMLR